MITRSTILVRCTCDDNDRAAAVENAIDKVFGLVSDSNLITLEWDQHDLSIEIDFDGDAPVGQYNDVLLSFLPFMVDNVETEFRFMERDRYEVRDQNGDVLSSSDVYGHATVLFRSWMGNDPDESLSGAGIYDNHTKSWPIQLRFEDGD